MNASLDRASIQTTSPKPGMPLRESGRKRYKEDIPDKAPENSQRNPFARTIGTDQQNKSMAQIHREPRQGGPVDLRIATPWPGVVV
jgi:hypothetical protein